MADKEEARTECQVYSRVVGFITPVENWNRGKKEEMKDRVTFEQPLETTSE